MQQSVLLAWIGKMDLAAMAADGPGAKLGPVAQAAHERSFTRIRLLTNWDKTTVGAYVRWLRARTKAEIRVTQVPLPKPTDYEAIYKAERALVEEVRAEAKAAGDELRLTYHLSPGTTPMCALWLLLAKTLYPGDLIESSIEAGVQSVTVPFEIHAEFLPSAYSSADDLIIRLLEGLSPAPREFERIIHRSKAMAKAIAEARRVARYDVPVLILGESGTGKELFAAAIHASSARKDKKFQPVNCGAIPETLMESALFGHVKGAFTDAFSEKKGYFEEANHGVIFLDEIGELTHAAQAKLLRVIDKGEIQKVGAADASRKVDVRVIAATNRAHRTDGSGWGLRKELYHRLAGSMIYLPPLRERMEDVDLLVDRFLDDLNTKFLNVEGWKPKRMTVGARNVLHGYSWPGNVRELKNAIMGAAIRSPDDEIRVGEMRATLFPSDGEAGRASAILNRPLGNGFDLDGILAEVERHYLERALAEAAGNKTKAAKLVGLPSYQTFDSRLKKCRPAS